MTGASSVKIYLFIYLPCIFARLITEIRSLLQGAKWVLKMGIASKHELGFHFYADDTQFYVTFETSSLNDMELNKCRLEACV